MSHSLWPHEQQHARLHWLLEKYKLKLQWGITSYQSEWPSSKNLQTINDGKDVKKRKPCTAGGNVNWYSHYQWRTVQRFLKRLKLEQPYDPAIPLLGIYPEKTTIQNDICTSTFIASLFTTAKTWKQPKCPLTGEWIKKVCYIHSMEYYSARNIL